MGKLRRIFGRDDGESPQDYVRRLYSGSVGGGYVKPVLPSIIELYDRVAVLERQVWSLQAELVDLRSRGA